MPFSRIPEITALISTIDTAMARADDIGNDIIRDLMPDLRDAIDEVNAALREVDALLFEGLRDEAVTLHDEEFSILASRLNLEDREGWPELERFFVVEGISPPPKIDYDTLSALESAHAELEELRRPLDKLRRLALERAPVARRLSLLRKLRDTDPTKPVWTQAINDHEEARVAELHQEARRVLAMRDPEAIAALHAELVDPDWGISVPRELVKATRGAELWMSLRASAEQVKEAGKGLVAAWQELQQAPPTPELVDRLRRWRQQYDEAFRQAAECRGALNDCPTVAGLVREEKLFEQIDAVAPKIGGPLDWLAAQDVADGVAANLQQICGQLQYLCNQKPEPAVASAWLADVERLEFEAQRLCDSHPGLMFPDWLRDAVAQARAGVLGRIRLRRRVILGGAAAGVISACLLIAVIVMWLRSGSVARENLKTLERYRSRAEAGEFAETPADVSALADSYAGDGRFGKLITEITDLIRQESGRRDSLRAANEAFDRAIEDARTALMARRNADRLDAWPESVVESARAWRQAREIGGEPGLRTRRAKLVARTDAVKAMHAEEEEAITAREKIQKSLEKDYEDAAIAHVEERNLEVQKAMQEQKDAEGIAALLVEIEQLLSIQNEDKVANPHELLDKTSRLRYPKRTADRLRSTQGLLKGKASTLANPFEPAGVSSETAGSPSSSPDAADRPVRGKDFEK